MATMPEIEQSDNVRKYFDEMLECISTAADSGEEIDKVERKVWDGILRLGKEMMSMFFSLAGDGNAGERTTMADGKEVVRLENRHVRKYRTVFGEFSLARVVYGTREGQKIEHVPLDARLKLPKGKFSYLLQEWAHSLSLEVPFARVSQVLERILGTGLSVNSLERGNRWCAADVDDFWEERPIPPAEEEGELLVCSADGKGVPMRHSETEKQRDKAKPNDGMHSGDKKMGLLGSVYTVNKYPRTSQQILDALFRTGDPSPNEEKRPKPHFKHVRAALRRDDSDTTAPQTKEVFQWMAKEVEQRGQQGKKPLVLLMDGQESLWNAGLKYLPENRFEIVEILDLLHAASYVWKATHLFYPINSEQAGKLARKQMERLLCGQMESMICSFREKADRDKLSRKQKIELEKILGYFMNNAERMNYTEYLAAGYPVASGVIEGACRTVIKDRMERSGMRWVFAGAHAMMSLRSIYLSDLWDDFLQYRIEKEKLRLYPGVAANDDSMSILLAA
jgi:hypothetical protein